MHKFGHILKLLAKKLLLTNYAWEESFKSLFAKEKVLLG